MFTQTSDGTVVAQVLAGRRERFNELVERHLSAVYAVAYAQVGNHADAEDVAQEAFLQAYQRLDTLRDRKKFEGWVTTIARNLGVTVARKRQREADAHKKVADTSERSVNPVITDELDAILSDEIHALEPDFREVLTLHYFAGRKGREIAELLNISEEAVRKRLQRGREALGQRMLTAMANEKVSPETQRKLAKRIVGLLGGTSAAWIAQGSIVASVSAWTLLPSAKLLTGAALGIAATVGLGWYLAQQAAETPTQAQSETLRVAQIVDDAIDDPTATSEGASASPLEALVAEESVATPVESELADYEEVALTYDTPEGIWLARVQLVDASGREIQPAQFVENIVRIDDEGIRIEPHPFPNVDAKDKPNTVYRGTLEGTRVQLQTENIPNVEVGGSIRIRANTGRSDSSTQPERPEQVVQNVQVGGSIRIRDTNSYYKLEGSFDDEYTRFDGRIRLGNPGMQAVIQMQRMTPAELELREIAQRATQETEEAVRALERWKKRNDRWPNEEEAEKIYKAAFTDDSLERSVTYRAPAKISTKDAEYKWEDVLFASPTQRYPNAPLQDRLMHYEAYLTTFWGDKFGSSLPILEVSYPQYTLVTQAMNSKTVDLKGYTVGFSHWGAEMTELQNHAVRQQCMDNLKRLGLAMKIFMNEDGQGVGLPGWRTAYPEYVPGLSTFPGYLTDTSILRCPTQEPGAISYQIVYPASNEAYWVAVYEELTGESSADADGRERAMSHIPVIIETHECARVDGESRRCVVFGDGHVSALTPEKYRERVEPYLAYK